MTEKLFYQDSGIKEFEAEVLSCEPCKEGYSLVLDKTAFFPEGGGQACDGGTLGDALVTDVREKQGIVYHMMDAPLKEGAKVIGRLDFSERFSKMQQHTGEHIVSGLVNSTFGYDNVGFHLGSDTVTLDFNGVLTKEQLHGIERRANEAVFQNLDIVVEYPKKDVLEHLSYRSKIEIEGQVRIVTIPGYDVCACCAPHVKKTGEIGLIKLTNMQNYKGGVRISMLCGYRALADYHNKEAYTKAISNMLSAKEEVVVEAVARLQQEIYELKGANASLQKAVVTYKADTAKAEPYLFLFEEELGGEGARELVNQLLKKDTIVCGVFFGRADEYRYVIGSLSVDVREIAKQLNQSFDGRGGGKPNMVQGSICVGKTELQSYVKDCFACKN